MNTAEYVDNLIKELKNQGVPLSTIAWKAALACVGWSYVFGARGQYCTPGNRRSFNYEKYPTIKSRCKNFDGTGTCSGCKWYPDGKRTRFFDCRGFTYWVLLQVYGWKLMGAGATSQWNNASNWKAKGRIADGIPKDTLVCLFYSKDNKEKTWEHTGFGLNGETVECGAGVTYSKVMNKKWTHWAIPACVAVDGEPELIKPVGGDNNMMKNGSRGNDVKELQNLLNSAGFSCGAADGIFGKKTEAAVRAFQYVAGLPIDGIVGSNTLTALKVYDKSQHSEPTTTAPDKALDMETLQAAISRIESGLNMLKQLIS